jgi:hypothetical protein
VGNTVLLTTSDGGVTIDLSWEPVYPALRYRVYRSTDPQLVIDVANEIAVIDTQQDTFYTDDTVPTDPFLYYLVTSEDLCGNASS